MSTQTITPYRSGLRPGRDGFARLLLAEWTKFRTVRGWPITMVVAALAIVGIGLLNHSSCGASTPGSQSVACSPVIGPGGEAVTDSFYFVHQPLAGNGTITVRLRSLAGQSRGRASLPPWSKGGIVIKASTRPGSAYAAMVVTGSRGVRMQYDYTGDIAGPAAAAPRWLRLTRSGDTVAGFESGNGLRWAKVGAVHLAGLPATAQAGLLAASPASSQTTSQSVSGGSAVGGISLATAVFDHVSLRAQRAAGPWAGDSVGGSAGSGATPGSGFHRAGGTFTVTGSGDIAPASAGGDGTPVEQTLIGAFGGLIAVIVVAAMFMTAEYRRGLIRVTLAASPGRGRVLAAKAIVIGSAAFIAGLAGDAIAVPLGQRLLRANGNYVLPVSTLTEVRVIAGTAALLAVAAILALALGALLRSSAAAITAAITAIVLPYLLVSTLAALPAGAADWLLRLTPAAGFAIQQSRPQYAQVAASYTPRNGYYPLAPWAGFAVLCAYAAVALGLAIVLIRRRDA